MSDKPYEIKVADFESVMNLKDALGKEFAKSDIKLEGLSLDTELDMGGLLNTCVSIASSKDVRAALFKCLARCTYRGEKITPNTFEDVEAREYYYPVVVECIKVNIAPFFKGVSSTLKGLNITPVATTSQK